MGAPLEGASTAAASVAAGGWTLVSRAFGFARVVAVAAVLGPTFLGNTFQAVNLIPNITYYLLTGSLFVSLLVPPLTRHLDRNRRDRVAAVAGGFLGAALVVLALVGIAVVAAGPLVLRLLTSAAGTEVGADQRRAGAVLLVMVMPQVLLYAVASVSTAVLHAQGRFGVASAAPVFENAGIIATVLLYAAVGGSRDIDRVATSHLVLLGTGATAAVALHAAVAWVGAWRTGIVVRPRLAWGDDDVRGVLRRAVPSFGYAGATGVKELTLLTLTNRVAGGVVAFGVAWQFYNLCVALSGRAVAAAAVPRLARLAERGDEPGFGGELRHAAGLGLFLAVPAAAAAAGLAQPLASTVAFGAMASERAVDYVAAALLGLAVAIVADTLFTLATHASYARGEVHAPLRAMVARVAVTLALLAAMVAHGLPGGSALMLGVAGAVSAGDVAGCLVLWRSVGRGRHAAPPVAKTVMASAAMLAPAWVVWWVAPGDGPSVVAALVALASAAAVYLGLQSRWRSPELAALAGAIRRSSAQPECGQVAGPLVGPAVPVDSGAR